MKSVGRCFRPFRGSRIGVASLPAPDRAAAHDAGGLTRGFALLLPDDPAIYAFTRRLGREESPVLANFTGKTTSIDLPDLSSCAAAELILGNLESDARDADPDLLAPWEVRVLRRVSPADLNEFIPAPAGWTPDHRRARWIPDSHPCSPSALGSDERCY